MNSNFHSTKVLQTTKCSPWALDVHYFDVVVNFCPYLILPSLCRVNSFDNTPKRFNFSEKLSTYPTERRQKSRKDQRPKPECCIMIIECTSKICGLATLVSSWNMNSKSKNFESKSLWCYCRTVRPTERR